MFKIAVAAMAYMGLFTSPSALKIPEATLENIMKTSPPKST